MQITPRILSIPPHLSTTWDNIESLKTEPNGTHLILHVTLKNGENVEVPGLSEEEVRSIFDAHAAQTQEGLFRMPTFPTFPNFGPNSFSFSLQDGQIAPFGKHNPDNADGLEIPAEVLEKIILVAKSFGLEDSDTLPTAEPNCNCVHCQVARAFGSSSGTPKEEIILEADLQFRDWEIEQTGEKLYSVTNPLDTNEHYNVFLGEPLGCTCGQKNCEHIKAVLQS